MRPPCAVNNSCNFGSGTGAMPLLIFATTSEFRSIPQTSMPWDANTPSSGAPSLPNPTTEAFIDSLFPLVKRPNLSRQLRLQFVEVLPQNPTDGSNRYSGEASPV